MASGSLSLLEAAKGQPTKIKTGVIQTIIQESPQIERLPWMSFDGSALQHEVEETLPDVQFRDVNETYSKSFGTTSFYYWGVAIMGGEVRVDNFIVKVMGNHTDQKAKQFAKLAKANAMRFDYEFYDGTGANKGFKGLKTLIDEGFGQSINNPAAGLSINILDQARDLFKNQGDPDALLINRTTRRRLSTYLKSTAVGTSMIEIVTSTLGKRVMTYDGIELVIQGQVINSSNAVVDALRFDEAQATTTGAGAAGSCYFIKYGEDDVCGLLGLGGSFDVVDFGEQQVDPAHMGRLEWYPGVAVFNKYSVVRVYGILDAVATA